MEVNDQQGDAEQDVQIPEPEIPAQAHEPAPQISLELSFQSSAGESMQHSEESVNGNSDIFVTDYSGMVLALQAQPAQQPVQNIPDLNMAVDLNVVPQQGHDMEIAQIENVPEAQLPGIAQMVEAIPEEIQEDGGISEEEGEYMETTPKKSHIPSMGASVSTSALHRDRKRQRQPAVIETEVRHSDRLKGQNKGYKRSICPHRDCHACSGAPPTLTDSVIKNLGTTFCDMKPEAVSTAALQKKKIKKIVIKKTFKKQLAKDEEKMSPNDRKPNKKKGN
ncbi:hypothetical protein EJB05_39637, partial [Eragrostis curvula]